MKQRTASIEAILDTFTEDPDTTIAMLNRARTELLLEALLADVPKGTNWMHLLRMANGIGKATNAEWFRRIIRAANNELRRRELLQAFVDYGTNENDLQLLRFEDAITAGVFDELIVHLGRETIENLAKGTLAQPIVIAYSAGRIQRFIEAGDPKRAFDGLVDSATIIERWRPPLFEKWVERVWQAHRDKGLLTDLTDDPRDWRNNDWEKTMRFGQNRTGFKTKKPKKPTINLMKEAVPLGKLWERYQRPPTVAEKALDWGEHEGWRGVMYRNSAPNMVERPGNMIRDMAWHWHNESKERKLRDFCGQHGIPYTDPV